MKYHSQDNQSRHVEREIHAPVDNFDGWIAGDDERAYPVRSVFGLAEEVHRKW